uniref:Histone deacetylase 11 n=1 Tax=Phallusia mammillata TaxID=59560 RepID=A0A6F9DEA8_9ASCI|nr:histone deacetylase 11 [Phallusia mammillata]
MGIFGKESRNDARSSDTLIKNSSLYTFNLKTTSWPIVYDAGYNITFMGVEKLHPFDSSKWGRVHNFLLDDKVLTEEETVTPVEATEEDLLVVHTQPYLNSLKWSATVAQITEVVPVALLPNFVVQRKVLRPLRLQTGGSIMAGKMAVERGWALNIGGGFHHCSAERGGGFCAYADITLLIKFVLHHFEQIKRVMIVDLDAHQGNGYARDFMDDDRVYVMDVFNRNIYPQDGFAKAGIKRKVELRCGTTDQEYLPLIKEHLYDAINEFHPQFVVYNAGTDILAGDCLGLMEISPKGVVERDRIVFAAVRGQNVPIVMLTSGGYQRSTARIIADSVVSLRDNGLIGPP